MDERIRETFQKYSNSDLINIIISNPAKPDLPKKIKVRPLLIKEELLFQVSSYGEQKVIHKNYKTEEFICLTEEWFCGPSYKQVEILSGTEWIRMLISKKGKASVKTKKILSEKPERNLDHNRKKQYILEEGRPVPFLVDLGVMTETGQIVRTKYDKFRQINRFLELVEDILPSLNKNREITVLDFGCGKSYLTFAMYYYLRELKGLNIRMIGLDLKEDVIRVCNQLRDDYGYETLEFLQGDIASYQRLNRVDMVVTLHACDTATDYALAKAVQWEADVILSVPCCQHELNGQINNDILEPVLQYGLLRERMSALITDGMRASLLEQSGYQVQVIEFIDMEHTPKNILIRGIRCKDKRNTVSEEKSYQKLEEFLQVKPKLSELLKNKIEERS